MNKIFIDKILFRLLGPLLYGVLVYVLVLLIFDSISEFINIFYSQEALVCVVLSYLLSELLRINTKILDRIRALQELYQLRIALQICSGFLLSLLVVSAGIVTYFIYIVGFSIFRTELLVFNIVFLVSTFFYNLLYFSMLNLNAQGEELLQQEIAERKKLEYKLESYKNEVNPDFLYQSLEELIGLVQHDKKTAELFVERLSGVYRYSLSNKFNELVNLNHEIQSLENLLWIYNVKYQQHIVLKASIEKEDWKKNIVPNSLHILCQEIINTNIISHWEPFYIHLSSKNRILEIQIKPNERLSFNNQQINLDRIEQVYMFYTDKKICVHKTETEFKVEIPLLELEPEEGA